MSELLGTSIAGPGDVICIVNKAKGAATYRTEFPGVGYVEFDVLPGAQFRIVAIAGGEVNVSIENYMPPSIQPVGETNV